VRGGHPDEVELTPEEKRAISSLKALAKRWPKSLWLFSASGLLKVIRCGENGEQVMMAGEGADPDYVVTTVHGIPNDGGDW